MSPHRGIDPDEYPSPRGAFLVIKSFSYPVRLRIRCTFASLPKISAVMYSDRQRKKFSRIIVGSQDVPTLSVATYEAGGGSASAVTTLLEVQHPLINCQFMYLLMSQTLQFYQKTMPMLQVRHFRSSNDGLLNCKESIVVVAEENRLCTCHSSQHESGCRHSFLRLGSQSVRHYLLCHAPPTASTAVVLGGTTRSRMMI